jgi:hypothetical protein
LSHFHLQYFPRTGQTTTNYGASFFCEIEALNAAGLANATRGAEPGYYSIQPCRRGASRPKPPDIAILRRPTRLQRRRAPSGVFPEC